MTWVESIGIDFLEGIMMDIPQMKNEMATEALKNRPDLKKNIYEELEVLELTESLDGKSNLEGFYNIWKSHEGEVGTDNKINSWLAFALGFTDKKPDPDGVFLPERRAFARAGFPDIDCDFDYEKRDDVYSYLIEKYGRWFVGNIGTHGLLKFKSCVTRVAKAMDFADAFHKGDQAYISENTKKVSEILSPFPKSSVIKVRGDDGQIHVIKSFDDACKHSSDFRFYVDHYGGEEFKKYVRDIENVFINFSYHASGIVISDIPLDSIAPMRIGKGGILASQFPYEDLESLGLIKFDILALQTLTVIRKTIEKIKENWGINIDIENLPDDDEKALKLYRNGNLGGVFQCEEDGMQHTMMEMGVDRLGDIIAGISLYRPGPMDSIPEYCARKKGMKPVDYFHPSIEKFVKPYLEKTYGVICYQESVMQICNSLAGFTISDGYVMIKAIGKKKDYLMKKFEKQFVEGSAKNGVPVGVAKEYWDRFITPFSSYGFNLAHSAAYGYISYQTAYLKAHYPEEFVCSLLDVVLMSKHGEKYEKIVKFEKEFKRFDKLNFKFLPRNINKCKAGYSIDCRKDNKAGIKQSCIRPAIMNKGISFSAAVEIEKNQPYANVGEISERCNSGIVDARCLESLYENGYLNCFYKRGQKPEFEVVKKEFQTAKEEMRARHKKGVEFVDIFA